MHLIAGYQLGILVYVHSYSVFSAGLRNVCMRVGS